VTQQLLSEPERYWHAVETDEIVALSGSVQDGLTSEEAARRLELLGPNVLHRATREGPLLLLWRQINSPLIWVLIGSSALAIGLGKVTDGLVVLAVVVLNTLIGFVQEYRAGQAIEALMEMVPENASVVRDGRKITVPVADLVPGDVVLLASGDKVPADMRLIALKNLQVEEAALTGESVPVQKSLEAVKPDAPIGDRTNMVFGGTMVTYGTATAVVVATGARTELGRISTMLREAADLQTPLTRTLAAIGKYITIAILLVSLVMLTFGTLRMMGQGLAFSEAFRDSILFAIALAVGAIPEGLPAIVTIALAIGVQRMAARRAIVRKLPAVETLGSTTVICTDKTGTLTRNEMTVQEVWTGSDTYTVSGVGYEPTGVFRRDGEPLAELPDDLKILLRDAALCSDAALMLEEGVWKISGDPTEAALVVAAEKSGQSVEALRKACPRLDAIPFESEHQFMATLHAMPDATRRLILKGAPEVILRRCHLLVGDKPADPEEVLRVVERLAEKGMRVLAVAAREWSRADAELTLSDTQEGFSLRGLIGMSDPPRQEAIEAVKLCQSAGIIVKMITGDHHATAQAVGRQLGLITDQRAVTGRQMDEMDEAQLQEAARSTNVFARVAPEHKLRLVRAIQRDNHVVAMTGDGVNDAPALKQSNIGVAMGITGTSVSKEAADIVLTDDNFASIAAAVEEGRRVYDNLIKSLAFVLPTNLGLAFILIYAVLFFPFDPQMQQLLLPMQPIQLLWINLVATVALALPLAFEVKEPDVMRRPPRKPEEPVLSSFVIFRTVTAAVLMTAGAVGLFHWEYYTALDAGVQESLALAKAQTMAVTTVIMFQIFYMLNCRSLKDSIFKIGLFSNKAVYIGIASLLLLQAVFIYTGAMHSVFATMPLSLRDILLSALVGAIILPVISAEKWLLSIRRAQQT
jgi:magnesium-transporting ATPase (P-type)